LNPVDLYQKVYRAQGQQKIPSIRSSEIKVRLPGSDQPLEAEVITQDRDLGLAWLQIKEAPKGLPFVDLNEARDPRVGEHGYAIGLISEEFDYAPYIARVRVQGKIEVPYKAFVVDAAGALVFDGEGKAIGFSVLQIDSRPNYGAGAEYRSFATLIGGAKLKALQAQVNALKKSK
jgi:hypothetical protein